MPAVISFGLPSKYWPNEMLLKFSFQMGTGVTNMAEPLGNVFDILKVCLHQIVASQGAVLCIWPYRLQLI